MTDISTQLIREKTMAERGEARARSAIEKNLQKGDSCMTPAGIALAKRAVGPLADALRKFIAEAHSGKAGRRHTAAALLVNVDPELAAYITIRACLNSASKRYTLKSNAMSLADRLDLELLADRFEVANSALYRTVVRNAQARGLTPERQANAVLNAAQQFDVVERTWDARERLLIGSKLTELCVEAIGIVEVVAVTDGKKSKTHRMQFSPTIHEWFEKFNAAAMLTRPMFLPTVVPPKPWTTPYDGAYFSPVMGRATILSRAFPGQVDALAKGDLSKVYRAVNALQDTPWRINRRVFEVMKQAWDMDAGLPCLPPRDDTPIPPTSAEVETDAKGGEIRKAWRKRIRAIHEGNAKGRAQRFEFARALTIAEENAELERIYFPHRLDFRGRAYAASTSLNPQGSDDVRGLLEFAEGKPLGERGEFWLGVHGANLFGNDKVSLEDRYQWAVKHEFDAWSVWQDPLGCLWWTEADKPWCFLAWCFEWAASRVAEDPHAFVSHLPIALDGSCNGIQHFSAMLRDPIGGAAVNLVPSDTPQDIYGRVAERVVERLKMHAEAEDETTWVAQNWLSFGIDRKITKRAVMVLPYGGTYKSCADYVREAVREKIAGGKENPFGSELAAAEMKLASLVWNAIGDVVVAARETMSWLQACARVSTKADKPLRWTTPSGFVVCQQYRELQDKRITTKFCGSVVAFGSLEETEKLNKSKQASAVSPNFVHSLDASALTLTIGACLDEGITSFAMIHDSYGTHAAETDRLATILRREFVRMYQDNDVLARFREEVALALSPEEQGDLPPLPTPGTLDLSQVLDSRYFFA